METAGQRSSVSAMQLALEALEKVIIAFGSGLTLQQNAINALRQALETEQEPVAWISEGGDVSRSKRYMDEMGFKCNPLYTAPPKKEWVGLKDEQVEDEWERITGHSIFGGDRSEGRAMYISPDEVIEFSRAIEAKLKEKNHG